MSSSCVSNFQSNRAKAITRALIASVLICAFATKPTWAVDSGLRHLLEKVEASHPLLKATKHNFEASLQDVEAAKRRRWPSLSVAVESDTGSPGSAPLQSLQIEQKLWDKGQLTAQIAEFQAVANASDVSIGLERQRIFLEVVSAWQAYVFADGRRVIALDVSKKLAEYREMMRRRVEAEVSPPIDLEVVESRILQSSVEYTQALSSMKSALAKLTQLSGLSEQALTAHLMRPLPDAGDVEGANVCVNSECWRDELEKYPSVIKAKWEYSALEARLKGKTAESWPAAYLRVTQPVDVGTGQANQKNMQGSVFVGLRYAPGAGFETSVHAKSMALRLIGAEEAVEAARRDAVLSFESDASDFKSNMTRYESQLKAVKSSAIVLDSYTSQFVAARKSWLDLLNAVRELSQSQFSMVEAQAGMLAAMYRLEIRFGRLKGSL